MPLTADTKPIYRADTQWFVAHPDRNYRVRAPLPGEVEELARKALPPGQTIIGELPPPADTVEWMVLVVKADRRTMLRLLTLRDVGASMDPTPDSVSLYAVGLGHKVAIDSLRKF